jgi:heme O synthase-like polyprenyltransferase
MTMVRSWHLLVEGQEDGIDTAIQGNNSYYHVASMVDPNHVVVACAVGWWCIRLSFKFNDNTYLVRYFFQSFLLSLLLIFLLCLIIHLI